MFMSWKSTRGRSTARMSESTTGAWDAGVSAQQNRYRYGAPTGLAVGTQVATNRGWCAVENLCPGDMVLTFDAGLQPITELRRSVLDDAHNIGARTDWPLWVPAGALGNEAEFTLMPHQTIMVESDLAEEYSGDPFALIPASALEGRLGIARRAPQMEQEVITLHFEQEQVVFVNGSALVLCPAVLGGDMTRLGSYEVLDIAQAQAIVQDLEPRPAERPAPQAVH